MIFYQIQNDVGEHGMEANLRPCADSVNCGENNILHVADFYLRGECTDNLYRHIFTFDLHPDSILEICKQVESRMLRSGLISNEQFVNWLNLLGLYLARHGLYTQLLSEKW